MKDDCVVKVFSFPKRHCLLATQGPFIKPTLKDRFLMNTVLETVKIVHGTLIQPARSVGQSEMLMLYMTNGPKRSFLHFLTPSPILPKCLNYFKLFSNSNSSQMPLERDWLLDECLKVDECLLLMSITCSASKSESHLILCVFVVRSRLNRAQTPCEAYDFARQ